MVSNGSKRFVNIWTELAVLHNVISFAGPNSDMTANKRSLIGLLKADL